MAIIICIGNLKAKGDASSNLIEKLSGREIPLAGIAELPYLPGEEILQGFEDRLNDKGICYLVNKNDLIQALLMDAPSAAEEVHVLYLRYDFLPLRKESCHVLSHILPRSMH